MPLVLHPYVFLICIIDRYFLASWQEHPFLYYKSFSYVNIPDISQQTPVIIPLKHELSVYRFQPWNNKTIYVFQSAPPSEWIFQFCSNLISTFDSESIPLWVHDILAALCVRIPALPTLTVFNFKIIKRIDHF